jgi:predicted permease
MEQEFSSLPSWFIPVILILVVWEAIWKLIALWKSARNNHLVWFILIGILNTVGILPIIYILINRKKDQE